MEAHNPERRTDDNLDDEERALLGGAYYRLVIDEGPGGPDYDENFEEIRHELAIVRRLEWTESQASITQDETIAILDQAERSEAPWFCRETLEHAAAVFRDWQENPYDRSIPLILKDHAGRRFIAKNSTADHSYDPVTGSDFGEQGVTRKPSLCYRPIQHIRNSLPTLPLPLHNNANRHRTDDDEWSLLPTTLLHILRDDRPHPYTRFNVHERLRQHILYTTHPDLLGDYLAELSALLAGLALPPETRKVVVFGMGRNMAEGDVVARAVAKGMEMFQNGVVGVVRDVLWARRMFARGQVGGGGGGVGEGGVGGCDAGSRQEGGREEEEEDVDVPCFVQNDAYREVDAQFHPVGGIKLLDDPLGFLEVDETTVVVALATYLPVRQIVTDIARPAVLLVTKIGETMPWYYESVPREVNDPISPRAWRVLTEEYVEVDFPPRPDGEPPIQAIYIRKRRVGRPVAQELQQVME